MIYHAYIDKSKRKPYQCGHPGCGKDITHPVHQPHIPGTIVAPPPPPRYEYWGTSKPWTPQPDQYGHEYGDPKYGIDDRQADLF